MAIRVRGVGPLYWGLDREYTGTKASSYAWVVETTRPYRKSKWGHLFAWRGKAVHFGICVREKDPKEIARWEGEGLDVTVDEIAEWRGPSNSPYVEEWNPEWDRYYRTASEQRVLTHCASDRDGDCTHVQCPQLRDDEPAASGRSCPLAVWDDADV